jgi:hypothetical protein
LLFAASRALPLLFGTSSESIRVSTRFVILRRGGEDTTGVPRATVIVLMKEVTDPDSGDGGGRSFTNGCGVSVPRPVRRGVAKPGLA